MFSVLLVTALCFWALGTQWNAQTKARIHQAYSWARGAPWNAPPIDPVTEERFKLAMAPRSLADADPELPRILLNTDYTAPTRAPKFVAAGADLQAAINAAQPGDVITLQAGATWTGNFRLPVKSGADWIIIRSSTTDANLPPAGTRVSPSYSGDMPKIVTQNSEPALDTDPGAHHYRFIGIEFAPTPENPQVYTILNFDSNQSTLAGTPYDLIVDRCYIHGTPTGLMRRGVTLNSASTAIIDSYISDFHEREADAQAIVGWNGPGPFKIVNNYLEASGENVMFGGADPAIVNLVPSDIEFRLNLLSKPVSWKVGSPTYGGIRWLIKNLFELKSAQRLLIDRNIFEYNWADAQAGNAVISSPTNQNGGAPWTVVQDVMFTNNIVRHSGSALGIAGRDIEGGGSEPSRRFLIKNNLFEDIDGKKWGNQEYDADGEFVQLLGGEDVTIDHNTIFQSGNIISADGQPSPRFIFRNNIVAHNSNGIWGSDYGVGNSAINHYFPGSIITKNVITGGDYYNGGLPSNYPAGNFFIPSFDEVGFVDRANGNYRLSASSLYRNTATDGTDIGCNIDALLGVPNSARNANAASYRETALAIESICSAFGTRLSTVTLAATSIPLPNTLAGTTVKIRDRTDVEHLSPLFYVSATQVNYQIPAATAIGSATVTITSGSGAVSTGTMQVSAVAPGLFTLDATGGGLPAGFTLRDRPGSPQQFESVARFDAAQNKWLAAPIDLGPASDQVYLILYGTGIRFRSALQAVTATIGGENSQAVFVGAQGGYVGLDQINLFLPRTLAGRGDVNVILTVDGQPSNIVTVNIK